MFIILFVKRPGKDIKTNFYNYILQCRVRKTITRQYNEMKLMNLRNNKLLGDYFGSKAKKMEEERKNEMEMD